LSIAATTAAAFLCVFLRAAWCLFVSKQISSSSSLYRCCLFHRHYIPVYVIRWGCWCWFCLCNNAEGLSRPRRREPQRSS
jgi:hypothetical protein